MPLLGIFASAVSVPLEAFESIASATGTGSNTSVTFSSIPSTYKHLQLRIMARSTATDNGTPDSLFIRPNNISTSSYSHHIVKGNGTSTEAAGTSSDTEIQIDLFLSKNTDSNFKGVSIVDILDYTSTSKYKTVKSHQGDGVSWVALSSGLFQSTDAITSLVLSIPSNAFDSESVFSLYGIKG